MAAIVLFASSAISSLSQADTLVVTVGELDGAIAAMDSEPDAIKRLVLQKIQTELNDSGLTFNAGELLYTDSATDLEGDSSCTRTEVKSLDTAVKLASDSHLMISLASLQEPMILGITLDTNISAIGRAKQIVGFRLGSCQELATDTFSFDASGDAKLDLKLTLNLNPVLNRAEETLELFPEVALEGTLEKQNVNVDVDDSLLRSLLEDIIEDQIDDTLDNSTIIDAVERLEIKLNNSLDEELDEDGRLVLDLPPPTDAQVDALYRLLSPEGDFSLSLGYLRTQRFELLAALLLGEDSKINEILGDAVQCEAAGLLQEDISHHSVYRLGADGCEAAQIPNADDNDQTGETNWFADAQCMSNVDYFPTTTIEYCTGVLDATRLGNAASHVDELGRWTLSPGTRFDIGAESLVGKQQPFTQRVSYKSVNTDMGECSLEMRIHSNQPVSNNGSGFDTAAPKRALIAYHGGSWEHRSSGALGIESMATQFVDEGFVVFAPFYRLLGTSEGNQECNNATLEDIMEDANDALDWVQANGEHYGVSGKPTLFGQSAGGQLAALLAVERPTEVASAVLFYAPVDFENFAHQLIVGEIETKTGQGILEAVVRQTLDTLNIQDPLIQRNTMPARIVNESIDVPPMFLLHGQKDTVLPFNQSVRMCDALAGNPESGPASSAVNGAAEDELRLVVDCGNRSELHLITEGEHALDLCIADDLCLAGTPASAELTENSVARMLDWTRTVGIAGDSPQDVGGGSDVGTGTGTGTGAGSSSDSSPSTGGATGVIALFILLLSAGIRHSKSWSPR